MERKKKRCTENTFLSYSPYPCSLYTEGSLKRWLFLDSFQLAFNFHRVTEGSGAATLSQLTSPPSQAPPQPAFTLTQAQPQQNKAAPFST